MITLQPQVVAEARARARQTGRPHNDARVTFVRHVLDDLAARLARARRIDLDEDSRADLLDELRDSRDVRREVNLRWMPLTAPGVLSALFASPDRMAAAAAGVLTPAEQRLLRRDRDARLDPGGRPAAGRGGRTGRRRRRGHRGGAGQGGPRAAPRPPKLWPTRRPCSRRPARRRR